MRPPFKILPPAGLLSLGIVAAALVGIIGLELHEGTLDEALVPVAPTSQQAGRPPVSGEVPDNQAAQHVAVILARPLFNPSRRPDAVAAAGLGRLTGVMMSPAGKKAVFAGPAGGRPVVVGEGARVGEYVVNSIDADAVTVIGPEGQRVLHPAFDTRSSTHTIPSTPKPSAKATQPIIAPTVVPASKLPELPR